MKTSMVIMFMSILPLCVFARNDDDEQKVDFNAVYPQWKAYGDVNILYKNGSSTVYKITPSLFEKYEDSEKFIKVHSIQFDLFKYIKKAKRLKRFIIVDFKLRTYPAIDNRTSHPAINIAISETAPVYCYTQWQLIGAIRDYNVRVSWSQNPPREIVSWMIFSGQPYMPAYSLKSFRIIYDTRLIGISSININNYKTIVENNRKFQGKYPFRSFVLFIPFIMDNITKARRDIIEVFNPVVRFADNEDELRKLPEVKICEYPYYPGPVPEKIDKKINPDKIYEYALGLLEGEDPVRGVELLEKAIEKNHVLAMHKLALCYWRGIGVKKSVEKAREWAEKAAAYNLAEGYALDGLLRFRTASFDISNQVQIARIFTNNEFDRSKKTPDIWTLGRIWHFYKEQVSLEMMNRDINDKFLLWVKMRNHYSYLYRNILDRDEWIEIQNKNEKLGPKYKDIRLRGGATDPPFWFPFPEDLNYAPSLLYQGLETLGQPHKPDKPITISYGMSGVTSWGLSAPAAVLHGKRPERPKFMNDWPIRRDSLLYGQKWDYEKALKAALKVFERGAKLGNINCALEALHCKLRLGKVKIEDFTPELDAKFADKPLYYMLKYFTANPEAPGVKEFLNRHYPEARKAWEKKPSAQHDFLLGLEKLYMFYDYGFNTCDYRVFRGDIQDIKDAYDYLKKATEAGIAGAQYLLGRHYIRENSFNRYSGVELFKKAVAAGHIMAAYHLAQYEYKQKYCDHQKLLNMLKMAREAKSADAWLLSVKLYAHLTKGKRGIKDKIVRMYQQAAQLGSIEAWNELGWLYYIDENKAEAAKYWRKFIEADRKIRENDIHDYYWEKSKAINVEKPFIREIILSVPKDIRTIERYYQIKETY